jgi:hypothetical protein
MKSTVIAAGCLALLSAHAFANPVFQIPSGISIHDDRGYGGSIHDDRDFGRKSYCSEFRADTFALAAADYGICLREMHAAFRPITGHRETTPRGD